MIPLNFRNFVLILGKALAFIVNLYFFTATHTKEKTLMPIRHRLSTKMTELCKVRYYFQGWMLHYSIIFAF